MIKGRGAASNPEGRFESIRHLAEDDGWSRELLDEDRPRPRTEVTEERARSVINRNDSPDIHFSQAINPYRGCDIAVAFIALPGPHTAISTFRPGSISKRSFARKAISPRCCARSWPSPAT
jgi:hypothetical protein